MEITRNQVKDAIRQAIADARAIEIGNAVLDLLYEAHTLFQTSSVIMRTEELEQIAATQKLLRNKIRLLENNLNNPEILKEEN